jgi:aryl-alcohol dehydrogenase-like predicted oxidoreductase
MRHRPLGKTNLTVPVMMLGGNVFGWTASEADSFRLLDRAFDLGLSFIDTADVYSRWVPGHTGGESEAIIGKWFRQTGKRNQVIIATKLGIDMGDGKAGLSAKRIREAVDESLTRLQTDRIDLYQSHRDDENTPLDETLEAYSGLISQGKIRFIGASNYTGARLRAAIETSRKLGIPAYVTLQPHYNLVERKGYETDLAPVVNEFGLGVIPYYSLASGFLSGKYRKPADLEGKPRGRGAGKYLTEAGLQVLAELEDVAAEYNSTPAAVSLAWLAAQPNILAPIVSATTVEQVDTIAAAAELQLREDTIADLTSVSAGL